MFGTNKASDGVKIEAGADLYDIKQRIGVGKNEELRQSEKRRRYLQKFARLMTRDRPRLSLTDKIPTAQVNQEKNEPHIMVTTRDFDQPATDFDRDVFDLIMQEALCVHELGHIFYTDHGDFKSHLSEIDMERKGMFKKVWNTLEDGAIERQLRNRYAVGDEILVMNANLFEREGFGHIVDEDTVRFSVFQAVALGLSDMAVYDSGDFRRLLDPNDDAITMANEADREALKDHLPRMKKAVKGVLTEPESPKRNQIIRDYFEDLEDVLDSAEVSGQKQSNLQRLLGEDGSISASDAQGGDSGGDDGPQGETDEDTEARPIEGKPDDTENDYGEGSQPATALARNDTGEEVDAQVEMASGDMDPEEAPEGTGRNAFNPGDDGDEEEEEGAGGDGDDDAEGDDEGDESDGDGGDGAEDDEYDPSDEHSENVSHELEDAMQEELAVEAQELDGGQQTMDEAERFLEIIEQAEGGDDDHSSASGASYEGFHGLTMDIPELDNVDDERWEIAEKQGKQLAKILRNRLQRERATTTLHGQRSGRLDRQRMMLADRGDTRIFEKEEEGDDKDYDAIIVVDRSGSMGGSEIDNAEIATAALSIACESVGVRTCILDMFNNEGQLSKPFGVETSKRKANVVRGNGSQVSGGTPLSETIYLARERVRMESDRQPFMIVVTDGAPSRPERYREELDKCTFPVLGVYMTSQRNLDSGDHDADEDMFHRITYATSGEDLSGSLRNLVQEVLF